jgi:hypothetical protein
MPVAVPPDAADAVRGGRDPTIACAGAMTDRQPRGDRRHVTAAAACRIGDCRHRCRDRLAAPHAGDRRRARQCNPPVRPGLPCGHRRQPIP